MLVHDSSFVGEDAYDDDDHPRESVKEIIDQDVKLNKEEKKVLKEDLTILGEFASLLFFPQVSGHAPFTDHFVTLPVKIRKGKKINVFKSSFNKVPGYINF